MIMIISDGLHEMHSCRIGLGRRNETYAIINWYSGGVEFNLVHSALRPTIDLLCQPRVNMMMDKLVE
jgi:hypothetical protein